MDFKEIKVTGSDADLFANQEELIESILDSSWLEFCIDPILEQENSDEVFNEFCARVEDKYSYTFNFTYKHKDLTFAVFEPYN